MSKGTILVIDDEKDLLELVRYNLEKDQFDVITVSDGESGLDIASRHRPDLIVLDLMMPETDGLEVCRRLRSDERTARIPLIMLTARATEADRVVGLEMGADDYITKPFSPREVVARVKAVLRRCTREKAGTSVLRVGDLALDHDRREVLLGDEIIDLTRSEFDILATMAAHPGRVYTRLQLLEAASGDAFDGYERTVDAHIKNIRRKLGEDPKEPRHVRTVFGVGYKVEA